MFQVRSLVFKLDESLFDLRLGFATNLGRRTSRNALRLLGGNILALNLLLLSDKIVNIVHTNLGRLNITVDVVGDDLLALLLLLTLEHTELSKELIDLLFLLLVHVFVFLDLLIQIVVLGKDYCLWSLSLRLAQDLASVLRLLYLE